MGQVEDPPVQKVAPGEAATAGEEPEHVYEDVPLASMTFDEVDQKYTYLCPCGDFFEIYLDELHDGEDIAYCTGCTLRVRVIFEARDLPALQ